MITSLVENTYDEFGEVVIQEDFDYHNWKSGTEYVKLVRKASPFQIVMLTFSILLCVALLGYSVYLKKKLFSRTPWVPPSRVGFPYVHGYGGRGGDDDAIWEAGRISRTNSGIVAMRTAGSVDGGASQTGGQVDDDNLMTPSNRQPYMYL